VTDDGVAPTSVDIVTVNWNSGPYLSRALRSVDTVRRQGVALRVIVVDNASSDGSLELAKSVCPDATIVVNEKNQGFAAACNQGAKAGRGEYILFMNPDVELNGDSLQGPVDFLRRDRQGRYAICGIRMLDGSGTLVATCARFPTPARLVAWSLGLDRMLPRRFPPQLLSEDELANSGVVDQVIGAFFLVRRRVFEQLGGFDERFFVYFEEVDLSYRVAAQGLASYYLADATAIHSGGGSSGAIPALRLCYSWESRIKYAFKHFTPAQAYAVLIAVLVAEPITRSAHGVMSGSLRTVRNTWVAAATLWVSLGRGLVRAAGGTSRAR
jgi:N-acetylglucosaminyl-diphospho-decaprenol L-rhamnosyltransferase